MHMTWHMHTPSSHALRQTKCTYGSLHCLIGLTLQPPSVAPSASGSAAEDEQERELKAVAQDCLRQVHGSLADVAGLE